MTSKKTPRLETVSSVSGGKSSAYMAVHYPTDHYLFAVVLSNDRRLAPKDKGLERIMKDRIPAFVASHEADLTLKNIFRLEEALGKPIHFVASEFTFEQWIYQQTDYPRYRGGTPMLPNRRTRFCTQQMKLFPIYWWCYLNLMDTPLVAKKDKGYSEPSQPEISILMNIGFRADEPQRVEGWTCDNERFKFPNRCLITGSRQYKHVSFEWRISDFPMYRDGITHEIVKDYWDKKGWTFPEVSNCRGCFFHSDQEMLIQANQEPAAIQWVIEQEKKVGKTFGDRPMLERLASPKTRKRKGACHCTD